MINVCKQAISAARESEAAIQNHLRGWAVIKSGDLCSLVVLTYSDGGSVSAHVVWAGADPLGSIQLVADHLNEKIGAAPELLGALLNVYHKGAPTQGLLTHGVTTVSVQTLQ